jgi:hypothetical protein
MQSRIDAALVVAFHDRQLRNPHWPVFDQARSGVWTWVAANHRYNGLLWREEERARRVDASPADIAAGKRLIDRYDRKRKDALEALDERLLGELDQVRRQPGARLSSQTAGAMIDRLSVLALEIHHTHACTRKREGQVAQRQDLMSCLDTLLLDARAGRAFFKVYRLNPYPYGQALESGKVAP